MKTLPLLVRSTTLALLFLVATFDGATSGSAGAAEPGAAIVPNPFDAVPLSVARAGAEGAPGTRAGAPGSERARVSFLLQVRDVAVPYRLLAITASPGEMLDVRVTEAWGEGAPASFMLRTEEGLVEPSGTGLWRWRAPMEPGAYPLRVESPLDGEAVHLNLIVLHPFDYASQQSMNGYRIGQYRTAPGRELPPAGFVEANADMLDVLVSPHFTLRQFLCKQPGEPAYLALSEPLLLKLEAILEEVRASGIQAKTLYVMSAFRTPRYNRAIGNTTDFSRHLWGDAADIFIDESGNGRMDDLNGDGRSDAADAQILHDIAERVESRGEPHVLPGGLSLYRPNAVRGPFIHVDTRGAAARW